MPPPAPGSAALRAAVPRPPRCPAFPGGRRLGFPQRPEDGWDITCARPEGRLVRRRGRDREPSGPGRGRWLTRSGREGPPIPGPGAPGPAPSGSAAGAGHGHSAARPQGLLPPGGDQDDLGGARGVPGPAARGLRRVRRRLVSAGRAGWPAGRRGGPARPLSPASRSSAVDSRTGAKVAIKKLYRPFQSELFAKRAYRELRLLKHMRHENVSRAGTPARRLRSASGLPSDPAPPRCVLPPGKGAGQPPGKGAGLPVRMAEPASFGERWPPSLGGGPVLEGPRTSARSWATPASAVAQALVRGSPGSHPTLRGTVVLEGPLSPFPSLSATAAGPSQLLC